MKRFACVVAVCLVSLVGVGIGSARAQAQAPAAAESKMYGEFNFGPTLGHQSSAFFGGEFGLKLTGDLDLFVEAGHMNNVGTTDLDDRATVIANYLGGTASTAFVVNHADFGVRYNFSVSPKVKPYVLGAVGIANVETQATFTVNGAVVDPATKGVQLGGDLSGTANKTMLVFGFGVNVPFAERFFADLGYRYGTILAKTSNFETDTAIPTQRIILGAGIRF
jgi:opacity protein-like surface antigen